MFELSQNSQKLRQKFARFNSDLIKLRRHSAQQNSPLLNDVQAVWCYILLHGEPNVVYAAFTGIMVYKKFASKEE